MKGEADLQNVLNTLGHDLRSPLFTAHGFLQLLVARAEGKAQDHARHALASVEEASRMVDGILQWARTHESRTDPKEIDLQTVAEGVLRDVAGLARRHSVRVDVGPLPKVHGDLRSLHYALQHLVDNAIRHGSGPTSGTPVVVRGGRDGDTWWVEVVDEGTGIEGPLEDLRVPFWETPNRGSGAGIALADKVAKQHGGRLTIATGQHGTKVRLTGRDRGPA